MMENIQHGASAANQISSTSGDISQLMIFAIIMIIFFVVVLSCKVYLPFHRRAKYFKMEMRRSDGEEYLYWRSELRKLYRKYIPLAFLFLRKRR